MGPGAVGTPPNVLDARDPLGDEHVVGQCRDGLIVLPLVTPVVGFRALREHFDDRRRVDHGVAVVVALERSADHRDVRVDEVAARGDEALLVGGERAAGAAAERGAELSQRVRVFPSARRHKTNMLAMDRAAHHEHDLSEAAAYFADFFASGALAS